MNLRKMGCSAAMLAILSVCCVTPLPADSQNCQTNPSDSAHVVQAMRTMYVAATNDDLGLFHSVAATNFYAFDNGKRYDGDALMQLAKSLHSQGDVFVWQVTDPQVQVDCNTAWITYVNRGSMTNRSGTTNLTWLESAVLQKKSGRWRISFFHSTRVP